jgi:hypothetical protein
MRGLLSLGDCAGHYCTDEGAFQRGQGHPQGLGLSADGADDADAAHLLPRARMRACHRFYHRGGVWWCYLLIRGIDVPSP